jgi:TonB family protein
MRSIPSALFVLLLACTVSAQSADSTKLVPIKTDPPVYPIEAQKLGIQGQVWLRLSVNERGGVDRVDILRGDQTLTKAAASAARKWKFHPFVKNGKAIRVTAEMPVDFTFRNKIMKKGISADLTATVDTKAAEHIPADAPSLVAGVPAQRVRVSREVEQSLLVYQVGPMYPPDAREQHVEGMVVLQILIGEDGRVHDIKPLSGHKQLVPAAIGAVEQWRYQPYLLNGRPVEVETEVTVNFTLAPGF